MGRPNSIIQLSSPAEVERPPTTLPDPLLANPAENFRPEESIITNPIFEKPSFLPPKPIPHSPKISPSSIPNPSPSVSTSIQMESGYPNYGGYLYSVPGYSAFQPVNYPGIIPQSIPTSENSEFKPYSSINKENNEIKNNEVRKVETQTNKEITKPQTDFEEQFTPEIIPAVTIPDSIKSLNENKMSITSISQGSGATVTIPTQVNNKDINKKKSERYSLKTSIPISKIDIKCVGTPPEPVLSTTTANTILKKPTVFNPIFSTKVDNASKVEIQSNIVIKSAPKEPEPIENKTPTTHNTMNSISSLLSAAEVINKNDSQFRKPEAKTDVVNEIKDPPPNYNPMNHVARPIINPSENNKTNFQPKPPDGNFNEQKNQIVFIQNKNQSPKMLVTLQQQNTQVLVQRPNFESKNVQVPSRLSSQKKTKEEIVAENGAASKVVALKRLHQENCDENDFENLITENQIYGNKIVVKEKSQGTLQEQDLKTKNNKVVEKSAQEAKNVVLQPNFVYLSNVQFPANLMMIKNNSKVNQTIDQGKTYKIVPNENKSTNEVSTMTNSNDINASKINKTQNIAVSKEIHVLKSSNNVLQTLSNKNSKTDIIYQPHQKVIMNQQIVYQVPMIVEPENKLNQQYMNREYTKFVTPNKKEFQNADPKSNDKLYIACPYQMDSKLQPKIVITNLRPKVNKIDEISALDIYEKRKRMRRLKYLTNREHKEVLKEKPEVKKVPERVDRQKNIVTPETMQQEICKELANSRSSAYEGSSDSESDYLEDNLILAEYEAIINKHKLVNQKTNDQDNRKAEFLANFRLGTHKYCKEKELDRQERSILRDSVASAYIAVGRIDRLIKEPKEYKKPDPLPNPGRVVLRKERLEGCEEVLNGDTLQRKQLFMSMLRLKQVTSQYKEGYERTWQVILNERKRRNGFVEPKPILKQPRLEPQNIEVDGQLRLLTEIKKSVNENNNLIKRRLDSLENKTDGDSIYTLAEKNISELNRLSSMADRSVKLISGQDTKRDLNPGFDSENIQKPNQPEQPFQNYPYINIPNISQIISLKSDATAPLAMTSQAISMDEPENSAAGVIEIKILEPERKEFGCQVEEVLPWPGVEAFMKSYKEYEAARKKEINELHKRSTVLRVEGAHITRAASRDSDRARALLAERQHLAGEELAVRRSLKTLATAIEVIRKSS